MWKSKFALRNHIFDNRFYELFTILTWILRGQVVADDLFLPLRVISLLLLNDASTFSIHLDPRSSHCRVCPNGEVQGRWAKR